MKEYVKYMAYKILYDGKMFCYHKANCYYYKISMTISLIGLHCT